MHSPDITQQNIDKLLELFPNCKTEKQDDEGGLSTGIDFDLLKQELSKNIVEGPQERYQLNWPGKKEALLTANTPIAKTLRPCREESVDFDTTENLFIEGDNLDALKLLQETYLGKVKVIYIDPPYNTGKDFVYNDDFSSSVEGHLLGSEQKDDIGNKLVANLETNGRFHSDWLSMIYSRLKVSRTLLKSDGVIFISIDEDEFSNLKKIVDEVFGKDNFIADFIWQNKKGGGNDSKYCAVEHEYVVAYAKEIQSLPRFFEAFSEDYAKRYKEEDLQGKFFWDTFKRKSGKQYYAITCPDGSILKNDEYGNPLSWLRSEARFISDVKDGEIKFEKRAEGWSVMFKQRMPEGKKPRSLILNQGTTSDGSSETLALFENNIFSNPKPTSLITYLLGIVLSDNDLVIDFFAGSGTTAHSVMNLNNQDSGKRKFILVQLPEECNKKSEAYKTGYKTISEISKERIRRAGKNIKEGNPEAKGLDIGFRVLKIDSSNMENVYYTPDIVSKDDLFNQVDHIKVGRSSEDLLFQVMLDWGVDLSLHIRKETIEGKEVYFVNDDDLVACFDKGIDEVLIKALAAKAPLRVVFRDDGFVSDSVKINVEQIFKQLAPATDIKAI